MASTLHTPSLFLKNVPDVGTYCDPAGGPRTTGSGVCLFEDYRPNAGTPRNLACILFNVRKANPPRLEHGGGGCDKPDGSEPAWMTAKRELREESANLFRIPSAAMKVAAYEMEGQYRVYAIKVSPDVVKRRDFDANVKTIQTAYAKYNKSVPHEWREMDRMVRVYVDTLRADGIDKYGTKNFRTHDTDGNPVTIRDRDCSALLKLLNGAGGRPPAVDNMAEVPLKRDDNYKPEKGLEFLKGTVQYFG